MKTEEEIQEYIDQIKENLHDHHIYLNTPLVTRYIISTYETIIRVLEWVLGESQNLEGTPNED